jgi:hypothetical protein
MANQRTKPRRNGSYRSTARVLWSSEEWSVPLNKADKALSRVRTRHGRKQELLRLKPRRPVGNEDSLATQLSGDFALVAPPEVVSARRTSTHPSSANSRGSARRPWQPGGR